MCHKGGGGGSDNYKDNRSKSINNKNNKHINTNQGHTSATLLGNPNQLIVIDVTANQTENATTTATKTTTTPTPGVVSETHTLMRTSSEKLIECRNNALITNQATTTTTTATRTATRTANTRKASNVPATAAITIATTERATTTTSTTKTTAAAAKVTMSNLINEKMINDVSKMISKNNNSNNNITNITNNSHSGNNTDDNNDNKSKSCKTKNADATNARSNNNNNKKNNNKNDNNSQYDIMKYNKNNISNSNNNNDNNKTNNKSNKIDSNTSTIRRATKTTATSGANQQHSHSNNHTHGHSHAHSEIHNDDRVNSSGSRGDCGQSYTATLCNRSGGSAGNERDDGTLSLLHDMNNNGKRRCCMGAAQSMSDDDVAFQSSAKLAEQQQTAVAAVPAAAKITTTKTKAEKTNKYASKDTTIARALAMATATATVTLKTKTSTTTTKKTTTTTTSKTTTKAAAAAATSTPTATSKAAASSATSAFVSASAVKSKSTTENKCATITRTKLSYQRETEANTSKAQGRQNSRWHLEAKLRQRISENASETVIERQSAGYNEEQQHRCELLERAANWSTGQSDWPSVKAIEASVTLSTTTTTTTPPRKLRTQRTTTTAVGTGLEQTQHNSSLAERKARMKAEFFRIGIGNNLQEQQRTIKKPQQQQQQRKQQQKQPLKRQQQQRQQQQKLPRLKILNEEFETIHTDGFRYNNEEEQADKDTLVNVNVNANADADVDVNTAAGSRAGVGGVEGGEVSLIAQRKAELWRRVQREPDCLSKLDLQLDLDGSGGGGTVSANFPQVVQLIRKFDSTKMIVKPKTTEASERSNSPDAERSAVGSGNSGLLEIKRDALDTRQRHSPLSDEGCNLGQSPYSSDNEDNESIRTTATAIERSAFHRGDGTVAGAENVGVCIGDTLTGIGQSGAIAIGHAGSRRPKLKVARSASSDSALGLDVDETPMDVSGTPPQTYALPQQQRRMTLTILDLPLRPGLLPLAEPTALPDSPTAATAVEAAQAAAGAAIACATATVNVPSKVLLEERVVSIPEDPRGSISLAGGVIVGAGVGVGGGGGMSSRRESAQSCFSDYPPSECGGVRYVRTPSVVVSDYSDDIMCGITLEEIEYFRAQRMRACRRGSLDANAIGGCMGISGGGAGAGSGGGSAMASVGGIAANLADGMRIGEKDTDAHSDVSAASSCSNLYYCGSTISALDGGECFVNGIRVPLERKTSACSACLVSDVGDEDDVGDAAVVMRQQQSQQQQQQQPQQQRQQLQPLATDAAEQQLAALLAASHLGNDGSTGDCTKKINGNNIFIR